MRDASRPGEESPGCRLEEEVGMGMRRVTARRDPDGCVYVSRKATENKLAEQREGILWN